MRTEEELEKHLDELLQVEQLRIAGIEVDHRVRDTYREHVRIVEQQRLGRACG